MYKMVSMTWPGGTSTTMTSKALPVRAYLHRRGTWYAVLRVDGAWVRTKALHVVRYRPSGWRAAKPAVLRPVDCQRVPEPRMPPVSKRRPATSMKTWPPLA